MTRSPSSSRILVLSSDPSRARHFVERVKALSDSFSQHLTSDSGQPQIASDLSSSDAGSETIPWTITNRYYTAEVHFEIRTVQNFTAHHANDVPAIIYVWSRGEKYQEDVPSLANKLESHDTEVLLAVQLSHDDIAAFLSNDEAGLDEFLSSHGFEYIDGDLGGRKPTGDGGSFSDESSLGVPGLPRVIDALSTIMWPNLVQSEATKNRRSRARELLGWARTEEEDDGLQALVTSPDTPHTGDSKKKSRMQKEMEELERWLEREESKRAEDDHKAWVAPEAADSDIPTPTIHTPHGEELGFEDDFDDFVGAPIGVSYGHERPSQSPLPSDSGQLLPMHTGTSYRSLASVDDTAGSVDDPRRHDYDTLDGDGQDPELPSQEEIMETTRRIFGTHIDSPIPPSAAAGPSGDRSSTLDSDSSFLSATSDGDGEDFDFGSFDLSRVLNALQGMKEEISGITDESERRKAAARVALGLVYGLQKEDDRVGEDTH